MQRLGRSPSRSRAGVTLEISAHPPPLSHAEREREEIPGAAESDRARLVLTLAPSGPRCCVDSRTQTGLTQGIPRRRGRDDSRPDLARTPLTEPLRTPAASTPVQHRASRSQPGRRAFGLPRPQRLRSTPPSRRPGTRTVHTAPPEVGTIAARTRARHFATAPEHAPCYHRHAAVMAPRTAAAHRIPLRGKVGSRVL